MFSLNRSSQDLFEACVRGIWGVDSPEVSMLYLLHYVHSSGVSFVHSTSLPACTSHQTLLHFQGIEALVNIKNGHQESTFRGGTQQLSEKFAQQLRANSVSVAFSLLFFITIVTKGCVVCSGYYHDSRGRCGEYHPRG
jgi:hypothetical protein